MSIAQRMKKLRQLQNLTAKEVALKAQVPVSTYRDWEAGREIKGEPYVRIAQALEVTLYELMTGEKPNSLKIYAEIEHIERSCLNLKKYVQSLS